MLKILKGTWLGILLILLASGVLLYSDLDRRQKHPRRGTSPTPREVPRLAILQWASTDVLDHTVEGMIDGLRRQGHEPGRTVDLRFFNAAGDASTGNLMARDLVNGQYRMVLTASTLALQAVAKANANSRIPHVFAAVTDPYGSGVGISGPKPNEHPPHLVGVGTFQPVESTFQLARKLNPALAKVGVVWSPTESNSEACVLVARESCKSLKIELLEANAGSTSEVPEAIRSLIARNAEAVWVGGDTVAMSSLGAIVSSCRAAKIPVFTNDPSDTARGALFSLGASYRKVGSTAGEIAGRILNGLDPTLIGVDNIVPEVLTLNEALLPEFPSWKAPPEVLSKARSAATAETSPSPPPSPEPGRTYKVGLLHTGPHPVFDLAIQGISQALADAGFVAGKNLTLKTVHATHDLALLPQMARQMLDSAPDAIVPLSTPCLQAVLGLPQRPPLVFGMVSSPIEAGAGKSFTDHLPDVTGAVWTSPNPKLFEHLKTLQPNARTIGVILNPSETNSIRERDAARAILTQLGITLAERTVTNSSEVPQAAQALIADQVDAIFGMGDNTVVSAFTTLAQECRKAKIPLLADDNSLMGSGALLSCGANPLTEGRRAGTLLARVLTGSAPASLPFEPSTSAETTVDLEAAAHLGLTLPTPFLTECTRFHHPTAVHNRPFRISLVNLVSNPVLDLAEQGFFRALDNAGFKENRDYTLKRHNAQGELSQLTAMLDAARASNPDLLVTVTTPAFIAATKAIKDIPIVFTVASDPAELSLFTPDQRPPNITGVHDDPPVDVLLTMAQRHLPSLTAVGILYDPSQPNSLISVRKLRRVCAAKQLTLHEATGSTVSEIPAAAQSLIQRGANAFILAADNLVATGFPAILRAAKGANIPIYTTYPDQVKQGATAAVGDNFDAWGAQSGSLAAKVLAGVPPAALPIEATRVQEVLEPQATNPTNPTSKTPSNKINLQTKKWRIRAVRYNDAQFSAESYQGILDGFASRNWIKDRDFEIRCLNAQGDMTTLSSIMTSIRSEQPDLVMPISTPSLQAALRQLGPIPMVFASVGDAVRAGAGTSEASHLPHVTGITTRSPFEAMAQLIKDSIPNAKNVGTLFSPAEINSELYREWFAEALNHHQIKLTAVPVNTSADTAEGILALLRNPIDLVCQIADNTTRPGFAQIARRAKDAGKPVFCFDSSEMKDGATLALARDYYQTGVEAAAVAIRVLQGTPPKDIPFANTATETLTIDPTQLSHFQITLPPAALARAKSAAQPKP